MTSTFFVEEASELLRLQISATVIPVTLCTSDNGVLEVRVTNHPDLGNWQFDWTGPGGFVASGPTINNVSPGTYTVSAIDITGNFCPSAPADAIITDERILPPIVIIEDNPLTNCDITKVNGQLSASVDGRVGGYDFEWYNGPTATGPIMHQANIYSQLDIGTYTVQVIDQLTQCSNTASEDITDGTVTPPSPTATVLNNLNDCIDPDGAVTADVNGSTLGYSFNWYDGSTVGSSPDETTPGYVDLDLGDYTVTATDLQTGCESGPATVPITDERIYPEFEYKIVPANCQTSNGAIEIVFLDAYDVQEVTWFDASTGVEVDRATNLYNYPAGNYEVTVSTFFGCETDGEAFIPTEITNYNGISANGDGLNDVFHIDCIDLFPNNIVKIFNRSGLLVYQGDNYNNIDIVFDGIGENGLYLIGENLPDGTYFYIIDKRDGTRPLTGYLELMR
jgi:gliding motility-associated-like protein